MKRFKLVLAGLIIFIGIGATVPSLASAATSKETVCNTLGAGSSCQNDPGGVNVNKVIATVINILSWIVGVVAVIMIIIGGFRYITSNGDSNSASTARNTILYAVIGLIVVAFAQMIVYYVLGHI